MEGPSSTPILRPTLLSTSTRGRRCWAHATPLTLSTASLCCRAPPSRRETRLSCPRALGPRDIRPAPAAARGGPASLHVRQHRGGRSLRHVRPRLPLAGERRRGPYVAPGDRGQESSAAHRGGGQVQAVPVGYGHAAVALPAGHGTSTSIAFATPSSCRATTSRQKAPCSTHRST